MARSLRNILYWAPVYATMLLVCLTLLISDGCSAAQIQYGRGNMEDCPAHSTFNRCMSRCPETCSNFQNPQQHNCLQVCTIGCECHQGFIKINKNPYSQCVKSYECPLYTGNKRSAPYPLRKKLLMQQQMVYKNTNQTVPTISGSSSTNQVSV